MRLSGPAFLLFPLLLAGCAGDQANRFSVSAAPEIGHSGAGVPARGAAQIPAEIAPLAETPPSPPREAVSRLDNTASESRNASQQSISGLGANVGKLAETLDAALLKINADFSAQATASADLKAQIRADLQVAFKAQAEFNAKLQARVDALASAQTDVQAGIGTKLDSMKQVVSAGRDSTVVTQFNHEFRDTLATSYRTIFGVIVACACLAFFVVVASGVLVYRVQEGSRRRAHQRFEDLLQTLRKEPQ